MRQSTSMLSMLGWLRKFQDRWDSEHTSMYISYSKPGWLYSYSVLHYHCHYPVKTAAIIATARGIFEALNFVSNYVITHFSLLIAFVWVVTLPL